MGQKRAIPGLAIVPLPRRAVGGSFLTIVHQKEGPAGQGVWTIIAAIMEIVAFPQSRVFQRHGSEIAQDRVTFQDPQEGEKE